VHGRREASEVENLEKSVSIYFTVCLAVFICLFSSPTLLVQVMHDGQRSGAKE
jgi:hypothetical protein